jgi:hypothetical protein
VPAQRDTLIRADVTVAPPFTRVYSWPHRPLVVCAQEVMEYNALEVNISVTGRDEQVRTWDCTPTGSFDPSESLYDNDGMAMSSVGDLGAACE